MSPDPSYRVVRSQSTAADFHARSVPDPARCEIWQHDITAPALVLGSSQDASTVDVDACRRAGVDVVRRRSGGGAVLLVPGAVTWIDVIVPAGAAGWSDDVHGPMVWLGRHLADVIAEVNGEVIGEVNGDVVAGSAGPATELGVHEGAMRTTPWSKLVCFDGVGAGEVLLDGRKLVGLSQRRTRHAARLQCCWYSTYDPARLVELLAPSSPRPAVAELSPVATLRADLSDTVVDRLAQQLA